LPIFLLFFKLVWKMTIHNLYIFDRHCQCIYFQKWTHNTSTSKTNSSQSTSVNSSSQLATSNSNSRLGLNSSSRFSTSSATSSNAESSPNSNSLVRSEDHLQTGVTQQSGLAAGSVISIEEEAKLVYGVILSLRNFVRKLSGK
jgi:hypothetical protein